MPRHAATATTRTASRVHGKPAVHLLEDGQRVFSVESGLSYRIGRMLGAGGFGQVFLSAREGRSSTVPETVCIKVSTHMDGWLREAYFGQLLARSPARDSRLRHLPGDRRLDGVCCTASPSSTRATAT